MAIRVTDSFTDVAGTLLENHTGETGATWTKRSGDSGSIVVTDANRVRPSVGSAAAVYFPSGQLGNEQDVSVDLHFKSDLNEAYGVLGRSTGPTIASASTNYYRAIYSNNGTGTAIFLSKVINGTLTTLQSVTLDLNVAGATNRLRLEIRAATKKVFVGTTEYLSNTDDTVPLNPNAAIFTSSGTASSNTTGLHLDSFEATDTAPTTSSRTVPQTARIQTTAVRTVSQAARVQTAHTRTVGQTASVSVTSSRTVSQSGRVAVSNIDRSVPQTARVSVVGLNRTVPQTAVIAITYTRLVPQTGNITISPIVYDPWPSSVTTTLVPDGPAVATGAVP